MLEIGNSINKFINISLLLFNMTSFGEIFGNSIADFRENFKSLFMLGFIGLFIPGLIALIVSLFMTGRSGFFIVYWVLILISIILSIYVSIGILLILKNGSMSIGDAFSESSPYFWRFVGLGVVYGLLLLVLFLLLIIPGIIFMTYWAFAFVFLIVENRKIGESLDASKQLVKGRWWRVFGYYLLMMILFMIVASIVSIPNIMTAPNFTEILTAGASYSYTGYEWVSDYPVIGSIVSILQFLIYMILQIFMIIFSYNFYVGLKKER